MDIPAADLGKSRKQKLEEVEQSLAVRQFIAETDWHKMTGKRVAAVRQELMCNGDDRCKSQSVSQGLLIDGMDLMNRFYFKAERGVRELDGNAQTPLFDLLTERYSPGVLALQLFSSVLHGETPVASLIWLSGNFGSFEAWYDAAPDDVAAVRAAYTAGSTVTDVRHVLRFEQWSERVLV